MSSYVVGADIGSSALKAALVHPTIRSNLPAYDPAHTPTRTTGAVAELFRTQPGTLRSSHPHRSIAANGPNARRITARHDLDCPAGERSPLAVLYNRTGESSRSPSTPIRCTVRIGTGPRTTLTTGTEPWPRPSPRYGPRPASPPRR